MSYNSYDIHETKNKLIQLGVQNINFLVGKLG